MADLVNQRTSEGRNLVTSKANAELVSKGNTGYQGETNKLQILEPKISLRKLELSQQIIGMGEDFVKKTEGDLTQAEVDAGKKTLSDVISKAVELDVEGVGLLTALKRNNDLALLDTELAIGTYEDWLAEFDKSFEDDLA